MSDNETIIFTGGFNPPEEVQPPREQTDAERQQAHNDEFQRQVEQVDEEDGFDDPLEDVVMEPTQAQAQPVPFPDLPVSPEALGIPDAVLSVLPITLARLLLQAPGNHTSRKLVEKYIKVPIPETITTTEELFKFIADSRPKVETPKPVDYGMSMVIEHTRDEYGRCNYSESQRGAQPVQIDAATILELADECHDLDELVVAIREHTCEQVDSSDVDFEAVDEPHYSDHESDDSGNYNWNLRQSELDTRQLLQDYLQVYHRALLERLDG